MSETPARIKTDQASLSLRIEKRCSRLKVDADARTLIPQPDYEDGLLLTPSVKVLIIQYSFSAGHVYFLESVGLGRVKIGMSAEKPSSRISTIRSSCPTDLKCVAVVPGGRALERELHKKYAHLRLRGEWFRITTDMRDLLTYLERGAELERQWKRDRKIAKIQAELDAPEEAERAPVEVCA